MMVVLAFVRLFSASCCVSAVIFTDVMLCIMYLLLSLIIKHLLCSQFQCKIWDFINLHDYEYH